MAPDINTLTNSGEDRSNDLATYTTPGYAGNGVPPNESYTIPDVVLNSPHTRRIRVISIGTGLSGIMNAYHIQKHCENVELALYEKNPDIGGAWLENRYPVRKADLSLGCGCDVPSHAYALPFALNPDWPRFFSYAADIWSYLDKVCETFGLRNYMTFNTEVVGCYWLEETSEWLVKLKQTRPDGSVHEFEDRCHLLLKGTGLLNSYKLPDIEGIEKFKGKIMHTAHWDQSYQADQWKNDRVAVIGSGASSIQTVTSMQKYAKHLDVFVRTGIWFVEIANNYGHNHEYTAVQKEEFRQDPDKLVEHAKSIEDQLNGLWGSFYKNSPGQFHEQKELRARMAEHIKDERLLKGFTPKFGVGCRRVTPGDPYMAAIQKPNVTVHFTAVNQITENGVIGADGVFREVDTIVCATGFDVSYRPRFPIIGRNNVSLAEKWKKVPEGYLGLAVPDMPNLILFVGPAWPVENGSSVGPMLHVSQYAVQIIKKLQQELVGSIAPKQDVTDEFNEHVQEWVRHTVWVDECRSWYKDNDSGRVNAIWPGSSLHYIDMIRQPRWEDFEIRQYGAARKNRWAFMGMGMTRSLVEKGDASPYLNIDHLDHLWAKRVGLKMKHER
ncbi:hypothetical protein LTR46_011068 [Exophiala xenobiotica]|nr:hypothetical protein LTR46_011068 [Exophiala xenobiotica]